jgi:hypothetical protein
LSGAHANVISSLCSWINAARHQPWTTGNGAFRVEFFVEPR